MPNNKTNHVDIAEELMRIHSVITHALEVMIEKSEAFLKKIPVQEDLTGFTLFVDCFITFIEGHHTTEDDFAFPYFEKLLPQMPITRLMREHQEMVGIIQQMDLANAKMKSSGHVKEGLIELKKQFLQLKELWYPHINSEETHLCSACICSVTTNKEQYKLAKRFESYGKKHFKPPTLVLPFVIYNMSEKDRAIMLNTLPWILSRFLIPIAWKRNWRPMQPYFVH